MEKLCRQIFISIAGGFKAFIPQTSNPNQYKSTSYSSLSRMQSRSDWQRYSLSIGDR